MINDFTYFYKNSDKYHNIINELDSDSIRRTIGTKGKVFYEIGHKQTAPYIDNEKIEHFGETPDTISIIEISDNCSGIITPYNINSDLYSLEYINGYCNELLLGNMSTFNRKIFYSVDLLFVIELTKAMSNLNFSSFDGEAMRILNAWTHIIGNGEYSSDGKLMLCSSKNEYGNDVRNRVFTRNMSEFYIDNIKLIGSPYGKSNDKEWALSPEDYSKVAALDSVMSSIANGAAYADKNCSNMLVKYGFDNFVSEPYFLKKNK